MSDSETTRAERLEEALHRIMRMALSKASNPMSAGEASNLIFELGNIAMEALNDETTLVPDDPEADATDFAHPAWWRGHDHTAEVFCQLVNEILDGKPVLGVSREPWQNTRVRLAKLVEKAPVAACVPVWAFVILFGLAIGSLPMSGAFLAVALVQHDEMRAVTGLFGCMFSGVGVAGFGTALRYVIHG